MSLHTEASTGSLWDLFLFDLLTSPQINLDVTIPQGFVVKMA
jgi:hypothetical protein